ncbi:HNH endonuclease signature motif containing protein [Mycobacterium paraterrae]|uniref:HNH endonuclease n=1 Tax=Mycobacterium paraterrae TaxID=577492 RepID=A0ABY3VM71_9MYCO|nr:HNH endonuclease signature motif containing protein [Mycobacterium paraterrae]UMB68613.1 HNH endonuclease [Mycobacterium paraterrae]
MFEEASSVIDRLRAAARAENRAAGERLTVVGELDVLWLRRFGERESWGTDTHDAINDEIAAALGITRKLADSYLEYARALRLRLPRVGALLCAGDIDYRTFRTIVYRTDLITDPDILAAVDADLAVKVPRWPGITQGRLGGYVDSVVARVDRDAVRRRRERRGGREFSIWGDEDGLTEVFGRLVTTDAHAVDARLDALAATVCADDPRTRSQLRADAMGALAVGADRLACRCGRSGCPAGSKPPASPVVIHVVADEASLRPNAPKPGSLIGSDALIPAELVAELARTAKLRPLVHPADAPPEPGYRPSRALADFVRCRDLTCRFPGCDQPATRSDIDHTVPHADGGATHASNLKTLCRLHHLMKTFWGWHDRQLADGTLIWTSPAGQTYVTTPGSAVLFPSLCAPTGGLEQSLGRSCCVDRAAMMPRRVRTRAQNRANYIAAQRHHTRKVRESAAIPLVANDEPPPF